MWRAPGIYLGSSVVYHMNDICNASKLLYRILYADDTCVLLNGKYFNNLVQSSITELVHYG